MEVKLLEQGGLKVQDDLDDLVDEQAWSKRFDATSDEQWDRLANLAREDIAAGERIALEDMFPTR